MDMVDDTEDPDLNVSVHNTILTRDTRSAVSSLSSTTIGWGYTDIRHWALLRKRIIRARVAFRGNPFLNLPRGSQCLRKKVLSKRICEEG